MKLSDRPTPDLVVLILTGLVCTALVVTYAGVFLIEFFHPEEDTSQVVENSGEIIGIIVGAVVGYVAGRGQQAFVSANTAANVNPNTDSTGRHTQ